MKRIILAALLAAVATPVHAEIRAVFVGIDKYKFSRANPETPEARFRDLSGAVRDVGTIKDALRRAYALDLDREQAGQCETANQVSITLTDYCATKAAILGAWNRQIDASRPGDTVIFYFAGHGSRFTEALGSEQASGFNSTIMATDAREPGAQAPADILDREIRPIIDRATAAGVRVVTIFDSCNSGTATRNLEAEARTAPPLVVARVEPVEPPAITGKLGAYRVHLAAAQDGQEAFETGGVGTRGGVFTAALAKALVAQPGSSFADLAFAAREGMLAAGQTRQTPHAEGALRATLGGDEVRVPIFEAVRGSDGISIIGGSLTGITEGSTFVLYPSVSAALPGTTRPLETGTAVNVEPGRTRLQLDSAVNLPGRLVARELVHRFETAVPIAVRGSDPALDAALAGIAHARIAPRPQVVILPGPQVTQLFSPRGLPLARLPAPSDPAFAFLLDRALGKVARVNALTALARPARAEPPEFCVQNGGPNYQPEVCPPPVNGRVLKLNEPALISVKNAAADKRFVYVLGIDPAFGISLLLPPSGAIDEAIAPGSYLQVPEGQEIKPDAPGSYRFVTLATDAPIPAQTLEQTSLATVDQEVCLTRLSRQACADAARTRGVALQWVNAWAATVTPAEVK
jgi:hypothetical protein